MFRNDRHKNDLKHECELPPEDDVITRFIVGGYLVNFRRKIRSWMIIDQNDPRSRVFLKSSLIISRDKIDHLTMNYFMIHPFSCFRLSWESCMILVMAMQLIVTPLHILHPYKWMIQLSYVADVLTVFDIILSFNTGFQDKIANSIIVHRKTAGIHYLCTTFIFDFLSLWECEWIFVFAHIIGKREWEAYLHTNLNYLEVTNSLKLLRCVKLFIYIDRFRDGMQLNLYGIKIFKVALSVVLLILWMMSLTYLQTTHMETDGSKRLILGLTRVVFMMYLFGLLQSSKDTTIVVLQMIGIIGGFVLQLLILCQMLQIRTKYNWSGKKFYQMMKQVKEYMRYKSLPPMMQSKIMKYCDFRFQLNYYKEQDIMKILSPQLQQEVMMQAHVHLLSKVTMFEDIPLSILFGIIYQMKVNFYMPSEPIIFAGTYSRAMYFINNGSVAVYTAAGKEICHLCDGDHFGELSLVGHCRHNAVTIVAIDCCEIYVLNREDFLAELEPHQEVYARVIQYVKEHAVKTYLDEFVDEIEEASIYRIEMQDSR